MVVVGNYRNRAELRKKPRRQFHYLARIVTENQNAAADACSIADISESGARLTLERDDEVVPDTFVLLLTPDGRTRRQCRVVWRDGRPSASNSRRAASHVTSKVRAPALAPVATRAALTT